MPQVSSRITTMSTVDFQHITTSMVGEVAVVEILAKELRFPHQAQELGTELTLVAGQDWAQQLLVNMKHTKYLSSTGFAILLKLVKEAKDRGAKLKFCNLDPEVRIGADIIGLDKIASLYGTEHEAIKAFAEE
jgi:anti-sigma B factor antagonist